MIYFIECEVGGAIKIGRADNPERRLHALQIGTPHNRILVVAIPGGAGLEARLHRRFREGRIHGEWFRKRDGRPARTPRSPARHHGAHG